MFKKIIAIISVVAMLLTFTACGSNSGIGTNKEFQSGSTVTGNYINEFLGVECKLDSDWTYMTDEEIKENNKKTLGLLDEEYADAIKNASVVTDMMATNANQMDTINVNFEKVSKSLASITVTEYLESQEDSIKGAMSSMGITVKELEIEKIQFAGKECVAMFLEGEIQGIKMYEAVVTVKCGEYMSNITVCTWKEDYRQELLSKFDKIA